MPHGIDLKGIEKNAVLTYFQDGLWDLVLGILLFAWGFGLLTDTVRPKFEELGACGFGHPDFRLMPKA